MAKSKATLANASPFNLSVSGRYFGPITSPTAGDYELELRIDVDLRYPNSPVLDRISGDLHQVFRYDAPDGSSATWNVYRESWIIDQVAASWDQDSRHLSGTARLWREGGGTFEVEITISTTGGSVGRAEVRTTGPSGSKTFLCERRSPHFRAIDLEVDVCKSANQGPQLPQYDTTSRDDRPADVARRKLTIEEVYREAGIDVAISSNRTIIDDSAPEFETWSSAELHDAMTTYFQEYSDLEQWKLWGMLAGSFEESSVAGIMFDAAEVYGGAGKSADRQGFAVFRNHPWFADLKKGAPTNSSEAAAARKFLHTWIHEAGHAFNLMHSWDKGRPDSLSWMNYDWRYDASHPSSSFWKDFRFGFDPEELLHLRHGDRSAVIMGGEPWASKAHLKSPGHELSEIQVVSGRPPLELEIRPPKRFAFLEPVSIELRLRNRRKDLTLSLDGNLHPEFGAVAIFIQNPAGVVRHYEPVLCKVANRKEVRLAPSGTKSARGSTKAKTMVGSDRLSEWVPISFGADGFYFDRPGRYLVRAVYQGLKGTIIPSRLQQIDIGFPTSRDQERSAADFFTKEVGLNLYFGGTQAPRLKSGLNLLRGIAERHETECCGARIATIVARALKTPFFRVEKRKIRQVSAADPQAALDVTDAAAEELASGTDKWRNFPYQHVMQQRIAGWRMLDENKIADQEKRKMLDVLATRGVKPAAIKRINASFSARGAGQATH